MISIKVNYNLLLTQDVKYGSCSKILNSSKKGLDKQCRPISDKKQFDQGTLFAAFLRSILFQNIFYAFRHC